MSNLEKYEGFFETDLACLSAGQITEYVQQKLTKKEKYQIEKHLLSCEFCTEAVEGISTFGKAINLSEISHQINSEIAKKHLSKKNKSIPLFSYLKVAAAIIILVTAGFFVFDRSFPDNQNMAFSEGKQVFEESVSLEQGDTETDLSQDVIPIAEKEEQEEKQIKENKSVKTKKIQNLSNPPNISKERKEKKSTDLETEIVAKKDNEIAVLDEFVADKMEELSDEEGLGFTESQEPVIEEQKIENITFSLQGGRSLKNQNSARKQDRINKPSLKKLKKEVKKNPSDLDLRYQYAVAFFDNKQWSKSLEQFDKILADSSQTHYYDALWYSALITIEEGKLKIAKEKLENLLKNEVYRDKAKEKLKEIE